MYYIKMIETSFKNSLKFKFDIIVSILGRIIIMFVQVEVWKALLNSKSTNSMGINNMIIYLCIGVTISTLYYPNISGIIGEKINDGSISIDIIRPINYSISMFCYSFGQIINSIIFKSIPVLIVAILVFKINIHCSLLQWFLFVIFLCLNVLMYWYVFFIIGLLHFTLTQAFWFGRICMDIMGILGGSFLPLWIFPKPLQILAYCLPFHLFYQFTQQFLMTSFTINQLAFWIFQYLFWLIILITISKLLFYYGLKRITINGG